MQDIPPSPRLAHQKARLVLMDNTWATPLYFRALRERCRSRDQAGTKYIGGHSDVMFGRVSATAATLPRICKTLSDTMGLCVGPDDMYLALRGLRTLGVRLARHYQSGLRIARWLAQRAGSPARAASCARERSGARDLETRFYGRQRPVQHRPQAGGRKAVHALLNELILFGHRLFVGRL